ncbi:MAG: hypothetical protein ACLPYY_02935 [Acidimicrobiales bacterium]
MTSSENGAGKADTTLLTLVVDRSGSMAGIRDDMEGGIKTLIEEQAKEEGTCVVTAGAMKAYSNAVRRVRSGESQPLAYTEDERKAASGD